MSNSNFTITTQYGKNSVKIKDIYRLIPSSPRISDSTVEDALKQVLGTIIVN